MRAGRSDPCNRGCAALCIAAVNGHDNIVSLLLSDSRVQKITQLTDPIKDAREIANARGHSRVAKLLTDHFGDDDAD